MWFLPLVSEFEGYRVASAVLSSSTSSGLRIFIEALIYILIVFPIFYTPSPAGNQILHSENFCKPGNTSLHIGSHTEQFDKHLQIPKRRLSVLVFSK